MSEAQDDRSIQDNGRPSGLPTREDAEPATVGEDAPQSRGVALIRALGAGLAGAGLVCLAAGAWVLDADFATPDPGVGGARTLVVLTAIALVALVAFRVLVVRRLATPNTSYATPIRPWASPLAGLAASVVVTLLGLGTGYYGFAQLRSQFDAGFPGRRTIVLFIGGVAIAVGVAITARRPCLERRRPTLGRGLAALVGAALVAGLAIPLTITSDEWRVEHKTVAAASAPTIPATVSALAWSKRVDGQILDAVPAGSGVAVLSTAGVFAFGGRTGTPRWSYRRAGASFVKVGANPRRDVVVLAVAADDDSDQDVIGFDADTGAVRFTRRATDSGGLDAPSKFQLTNTSAIGGLGSEYSDNPGFRAISLRTGANLWDYRAPKGCSLDRGRSNATTVPTGLVVELLCGGHDSGTPQRLRVQLLDATDGHVRWRHDETLPFSHEGLIETLASASPDGRFVAYSYSDKGFIDSDYRTLVLDSATGTRFSIGRDVTFRGAGTYVGPDGELRDVRTKRLVLRDGTGNNCALAPIGVLLERATVCAEIPYRPDARDAIASVRIAGLPDDRAAPALTIPLGRRHDRRANAHPPLMVVAAPGAVVIADTGHNGPGAKIYALR